MSDSQKDWEEYIERIKRSGAGEYGAAHFMCRKHEHWKMLWAADRIAELEQQLAKLRKEKRAAEAEATELWEALEDMVDGKEWWDIHESKGLPKVRCEAILALLKQGGE